MPKNGRVKGSGKDKRKADAIENSVAVASNEHQDQAQEDSQPAKKQQIKVSKSIFLRQSEQVLDCFFGFSGIIVASFYAGLSVGGAEKYQAWRAQLSKGLSEQLDEFQGEFSNILQSNEAARTDFTNLISGSPTDKKNYGLVHLATTPEAPGARAAVFPSVFRKAEIFLQNYDYAEVVTALFHYKEVLLAANKNWYESELLHSALAMASQSQPDSFPSTLTEELSNSLEESTQFYGVDDEESPEDDSDYQLLSSSQNLALQRTASVYGSNASHANSASSSVVAVQRSYSASSTNSNTGSNTELVRTHSILSAMQSQARQLVQDEQESLSQGEKVDSLPPVSDQLKRTVSARMATRRTPASIVPEKDNVLRYLFTILKYQFVTKGQQWFSPLILGPENLEGKIFSRIVRRAQPVENSSIIFRNYAVATKRAKTQAVKLIAEINTFFESKGISLNIACDSSNPNYVEARFNHIDQHKAALHDVYKSGGFKQLLFFEQQAREELGNAATVEHCTAAGSNASSSSSGATCGKL